MTRVLRSQEYVSLRRELIAAREKKGLTQAELAAQLGRTQSFVSKYEQGERRLDVVDFERVCRCLAVDPGLVLKALSG